MINGIEHALIFWYQFAIANRLKGVKMTIYEEIQNELAAARLKHKPFPTMHHGYSVIKEEIDEVWDEIKHDSGFNPVRKELVQVAAMCVRFIEDLEPK